MSYCVLADIERTFGTRNVTEWSNLDQDDNATTIAARQARAITITDAEIDAFMANGPYPTPIIDLSGTTPTLINEVAATLTGIWLYEGKGVTDIEPKTGQPVHRYAYKSAWAWRVLKEIKEGTRVIPGMK
jgi:hypothetical protein